jgi:microsomal dipeptidase-like Zn-dependent dipeptidase
LDALLGDRRDRTVLIHAVEGGFHVGGEPGEVRAHMRTLAQRGVVYITVAHLFWRQVATNANALPFLPDRVYRFLFRQPPDGLSPIGRATVEAMIDEGLLIDITHMNAAALHETFELLDARDPDRTVPVIASHMACRFGGLEYALTDEVIRRVADRGGLLGTILCEHFMTSGVKRPGPRTAEESIAFVCAHIDHVRALTGSVDAVAIGSDLDGYIKPALPGLEHMGHMRALQDALVDRYGEADAAQICHGNALRVLRQAWLRPG